MQFFEKANLSFVTIVMWDSILLKNEKSRCPLRSSLFFSNVAVSVLGRHRRVLLLFLLPLPLSPLALFISFSFFFLIALSLLPRGASSILARGRDLETDGGGGGRNGCGWAGQPSFHTVGGGRKKTFGHNTFPPTFFPKLHGFSPHFYKTRQNMEHFRILPVLSKFSKCGTTEQ